MQLTVLYEDGDIVAVEKPAGIHTAPLVSLGGDSLLDRLIRRFPEIAGVPGIKPVEPGLLHRLDRETSGVVIAARNPASFAALREQFDGGGVTKGYAAVCWTLEERAAAARVSMESRFAPYGPGRKRVRVIPLDAPLRRDATETLYRTEVEIGRCRGKLALLRATLVKGFRHQVRAHLAALELPIVGDALYGRPTPPGSLDRMYLHAHEVRLVHPRTGQNLIIRSAVPPEFTRLLDE